MLLVACLALLASTVLLFATYIYTHAAVDVIIDGIRYAVQVGGQQKTFEEMMQCQFSNFHQGEKVQK
jgi:hypothetical protein